MNERPNYRQRPKKRPRKKKSRRLFNIIWRFLLLFIFLYLVWFGLRRSGLFTIKSVTVSGNDKVSSEMVVEEGHLQKGTNYFSLSSQKREKELEQIPYVKTAKVKYHFGGKVTVSITERKPAFQLYTTQYFLVDNQFRILEQKKDKMENILNIEGIDLGTKKPGDYILTEEEYQVKRELLQKLMTGESPVAESFRSIDLLESVATFITIDGIRVEFGSYNNIDYKLKMLQLILKDIHDTGKKASAILLEKGPNPIAVEESNTTDKSKKAPESEEKTNEINQKDQKDLKDKKDQKEKKESTQEEKKSSKEMKSSPSDKPSSSKEKEQ